MEILNKSIHKKPERKIKIMQFGEGNFLRAFVEWILQDLNDKGAIEASVAVVQPMPFGRVKELADQDGLYTLRLVGIDNGENVRKSQIIDVIGDCINPFTEYEKYLKYGESEDLQVIISNTTEAGIAVDASDTDFSKCPKSFPGKLLALLKRRYDRFKGDMNKGLAIIPCELIDDNGDELYRCLTELAKINKMDEKFIKWMQTANHFTSTLVDRIVPGYPKNEIEAIQKETGYIDNNVVKGEIFHLWVLKKEPFVQKVLPADKTGLNVIFADDLVIVLRGNRPVDPACGRIERNSVIPRVDRKSDRRVPRFVEITHSDGQRLPVRRAARNEDERLPVKEERLAVVRLSPRFRKADLDFPPRNFKSGGIFLHEQIIACRGLLAAAFDDAVFSVEP